MSKDKSATKPAKGTGLPALDHSPSHLLHRALQLALDLYAAEFGPAGITQRQYAVLAAVELREGLTQTDLVHITGIDRSTLADMVARMITKGLLERRRSEADARANAVRLTLAGREALVAAGPKMDAVDARLLKLLSSGKRRALNGLLHDLIAAAAPAPPKKTKRPKAASAARPARAGKPAKPEKKPKKPKKAA